MRIVWQWLARFKSSIHTRGDFKSYHVNHCALCRLFGQGLSSGSESRYFKNHRLRSWEEFKANFEAHAKAGGSILAQLVLSLNTNQQGSCTSELFPRENTLEALVKQRKACGGDDDRIVICVVDKWSDRHD
jgi:hypothetical protein